MARMVVRDGAISTAGAALAQADLMLSLVARHGSEELARSCARFLMLDHRVSQSHSTRSPRIWSVRPRRCSAPIQYVQKLRVERATQRLETDRVSIESVAAQVGYADASMRRKLLRRERCLSPRRSGRSLAVRLHRADVKGQPAHAKYTARGGQ